MTSRLCVAVALLVSVACQSRGAVQDESLTSPTELHLEGEQLEKKAKPATPAPSILPSEHDCEARRQSATESGCITAPSVRALRYMHAAPICDASDLFLRWEVCEHPTLIAIRTALEATENWHDEVDVATGNWALESVTFTKKQAHPSSLGQRIMVIDGGMETLAIARYKSRTLDYLVADDNGIYNTWEGSTRLPKIATMLWSEILDEKDAALPSIALNPITALFNQRTRYSEAFSIGHGRIVLNKLADANPRAEFVIVEAEMSPPTRDFCGNDDQYASLQQIESFISNLANSLIQRIKEHKINFINASFGHSLWSERSRSQDVCGKNQPSDEKLRAILNIWLEKFYIPLSTIDNVILVQAGATADQYLDPHNSPDFLIDCASLPNRLRVGAFSLENSGLPREGANAWELLRPSSFYARDCTDLYINGGIDQSKDEFPLAQNQMAPWFSNDAIGCAPFEIFAPSWAAPLALSYLIQLKARMPADTTPAELIAAATNYGRGRLKDLGLYELNPVEHYSDPYL